MKPRIPSSEDFNGVWFVEDNQPYDTNCWSVPFFEGKKTSIPFRIYGEDSDIPIIRDITLQPAPTMTFLNPRPAPDSPSYPWRFEDGANVHVIKLPVPLTFEELAQGSQIVVTGVTEKPEVIEGSLVANIMVEFRAGGLLIGNINSYSGETDLVALNIDEFFTGEVLAVNFDKAYKNLPAIDSLQNESGGGPYQYYDGEFNKIARCVLNSYCLGMKPLLCQPKVSAGDVYRIYNSIYVANVGEAIETSIVYGGRDLYVIQVGLGYKLKVLLPNIEEGWKIQYPEI